MPQPQFVFDRFGRVLRQELTGLGDTALTMGKNMVMQPAAGYAGLLDLVRGRGLDSAVDTIDSTQAIAGGPSTREGMRNLQAVGDTMGLLTEPLKRGVDVVGEYSPLGGAVLMGAGAAFDPTKLGRAGKLVKGAERTSEVARVNRRVGTTGQYVGAPSGVDSPQALGAMVNNYLAGMTEGMAGRNFYRDSSADIYARTGRDPVQSDLLAQNIAALSRSNNVGGNTSMSAKGHIQAATGEPVITGRFPTRDSPPLQAMYDAGLVEYLGHKRDPFATQLGVAYAPERVGRGVNDMHEAELMGYPSGKVSGGAQHDFMDEVRARAIEKANAQSLGGFADWDTGTSQAAAWSGNKIRRGDINPGDAAKSYADYFPLHEANATYEAVSSPVTGHLQGLLDAPFDERLAYTMDPRGSWDTSPSGRDIGYTAARMLPGETVQTVGRFKNSANPAFVARPVTGTMIAKDGTRSMTPGSVKALNAVEASRAYFDGQEAGGWHKVMPAPNADAYRAVALDFGRPFTEADMSAVAPLFEANGYFLGSSPSGITVMGRPAGAAYPGDPGTKIGKDFAKEVRDIIKANKGVFKGANTDFGALESGYLPYTDAYLSGNPGSVTTELLKYMDEAPETKGLLNDSQGYRDTVVARNPRDTDAAAKGYGVARADMVRARKIFAEQGYEGLRRAAAAGTVPAALLAAGGLFAAGEDTSGD